MTSSRNILFVAFLLVACLSCQSRKAPIVELQDRLDKDGVALQQLQAKYQEKLRTDFRWCDSMLQYVPEDKINTYFDILDLAQAYLSQFDEMLPVMQRDITYTHTQLTNLQNDLDTHYISDSLFQVYLKDETAVADTLHNRILYFQDRLSHQDQELQTLKKNISKVVSK